MIDRRSFVTRAGLLAAGSVFGGSIFGCQADYAVEIPCLGPAQAPTPVAGMTYIRASEIGCALDCDLSTGRNKHTGGAATDDGPRINAAMGAASASNPITLIIDGSALISGLFLPAGGYWSIAGLGCGTGFFIKSGANNDGIHNGPPDLGIVTDPGPPAPARGSNVSLSNFAINGNHGNGRSGDSSSGKTQGIDGIAWYFNVNLINLNNIQIENVATVNPPAYHFRFTNVGDVTVTGCALRSMGTNTDGLHFDGPANDIAISNCSFETQDDSIGLNCPEGYSGNISRVTVSDCTFNSFSMMRLYTAYGPYKYGIDEVLVKNCTGTLSEAAFLIGIVNGNPNAIASLTIEDCNLKAPAVLALAESFGTIALKNVSFTPQVTAWWQGSHESHACGFVRPSPPYPDTTFIGSSLTLENCTIYRNEGKIEVEAVILEGDSTIENLVLNGFELKFAKSYSKIPELLSMQPGAIGQLTIDSLDTSNIAGLVAAEGFSSLGSVCGTGVLATGWEFPDAVMANGVPYISATTGLPSIKIDGVVELYPQT